jgi:thiol-disulfide isomerase/thioredoxin
MKKLIPWGLMMLLGAAVSAQSDTPARSGDSGAAATNKTASARVDFAAELESATAKLKEKFASGKTNQADLDENLSAINALIVKYGKTGDREQVARLYLLDAHIYADGLGNLARAQSIWAHVVREFPGTIAARGAAASLAQVNAQLAAAPDPSIPEGLLVGQRFPVFNESSLSGAALNLAAYRGKVTLIDFWATWCGPCKAEMPNVIATYRQYHERGFEIIGVSLDQERGAVSRFTAANGMTWQQYFDGLGWKNKLAEKYGVDSIPMAYLLDRHGIIVGKSLRGPKLTEAVDQALVSK